MNTTEPTKNIKKAGPFTGRRKSSVARVWESSSNVKPGIFIKNQNKSVQEYFSEGHVHEITTSLRALDLLGKINLSCTVQSGGISGQAGAIKLAIARFLLDKFPETRPTLSHQHLLTCDHRKVFSKVSGLRKSRAQRQRSKR